MEGGEKRVPCEGQEEVEALEEVEEVEAGEEGEEVEALEVGEQVEAGEEVEALEAGEEVDFKSVTILRLLPSNTAEAVEARIQGVREAGERFLQSKVETRLLLLRTAETIDRVTREDEWGTTGTTGVSFSFSLSIFISISISFSSSSR
jgi:hypothetical protein